MAKDLMFFCHPQQAYMRTTNCKKLRQRPIGKAPAGAQPRLRACENCTMYSLVDALEIPTITVEDYLAGQKPAKSLPAAATAAKPAKPRKTA